MTGGAGRVKLPPANPLGMAGDDLDGKFKCESDDLHFSVNDAGVGETS